ncbi:hypothetical protein niasHS_005946 [Heterodera schachtii]|uniref:ShKT domain-containing protein n=1 Tax=Heterodera schachtii TaxID=97005 RepID=A0ABD2JMZ9_HETSC
MTNFPIAILLLLSSFAVNTVLTAPPPHIVPPQVAANSDNYCDSVPAHVRHGCKMVAQIWAEARKAETEGRIVTADDLPPPYHGIGLPCHRRATLAELAAQPPPRVVAERYACLNMTCLCPFLGGVSSAHDQCTVGGGASSTPFAAMSAVAVPSPRARRQSGTPAFSLGRAVRMEYRMLSDDQRARFHGALQLLKRGFGSFEYDRLTALHSNANLMPSAHGGPTFLLWHREYLKRMEIALRAIDPSVAIPFWDSAMDQRLPNPADSVIWSSSFMGALSAAGTVADGPVAGWITPSGGPIRRSLGTRGGNLLTEQEVASLIGQPQIENVLAFTSRARNGACTQPTPNPLSVLEFIHNGVHAWVGGDMLPLTTSPQDPVFFLHHSFIDYIWEQWRLLHQNRQQRETQFPPDAQIVPCAGSQNYLLSATMFPFQDPVVLNRAGLSNAYTDSLYTYAPRPTCRAAGDCRSRYLFCDTTNGRPLCTSRIKPGGNCASFVQNADQPCFASTCVNGFCQAGGAAVAAQPQQQQRIVRSIVSVPNGTAPAAAAVPRPSHQPQPLPPPPQYAYHQYPTVVDTIPMPPRATSATEKATVSAWGVLLTTPLPTPSPPVEEERVCHDTHECCAHWAASDACRTAPRFMNTWCPAQCRFDGCRPHPEQDKPGCQNLYSECQRWAHYHEKVVGTPNECQRNPHWMAQNCAKACQKCGATKPEQCIKNMPMDYEAPPMGFD